MTLAVEIEGQVGPAVLADGVGAPVRQGKQAEAVVTELHGKYFEQSYRGNAFSYCQQAGVILSTLGVSTATARSMALYNPIGSGKLLSLIRFELVLTAAAATPVIGAYGLSVVNFANAATPTGTAAVANSVNPTLFGSGAKPVGVPLTGVTVPGTPAALPILARLFATKLTGAITTAPDLAAFAIEFDGTLVLQPGTFVCPEQLAADSTNASALAAVVWEELPA